MTDCEESKAYAGQVLLPSQMIRLGIIVSEFNRDITEPMLQSAVNLAQSLEAAVTYIFKVPGCYDIPIGVKSLLERDDVDAVVALGAVITGETEHDKLISQTTALKMADLAVQFGKPVTLGISGPGMSKSQAEARVDEYARRSVEAAIKLVKNLRRFRKESSARRKRYPVII